MGGSYHASYFKGKLVVSRTTGKWRAALEGGDQLANWQAQLLETQPNVNFLPQELIFVRFQKFIKLNIFYLKERRNTGKTSPVACS